MGWQGGCPESLLNLEPGAADQEAPHDEALVILELDHRVLTPLFGGLEEVAVDELEVLVVVPLEAVEVVYVRNEAWVSDVIEGDVDPSSTVVVSLNNEEVIVVDEGALLIERGCHVKGFGIDGLHRHLRVSAPQDDRVGCIGEQGIPWGDDKASIQAGDKDRVACIATLVKSMPS